MRTIIGINVSKNKANVAVATDLVVVKELVISLDALRFNELKHVVPKFGGNTEIVFEATGIYSRLRKNDERDAGRLEVTEFTEHLEPCF